MKQICENCGRTIGRRDIAYHLKVQMYADPSPPEFTQEELEADFETEMLSIIEQMNAMDPREAEDEVHEAYLFTLCAVCRQRMHKELRRRQMPFEQHF